MRRNLSNFLILFFNIISFVIALLLLEYEISRSLHPLTCWAPSPEIFDYILAFILIIFSLFSITSIILIYFKKISKPILQLSSGRMINLSNLIYVFTAVNFILIGILIAILKSSVFFIFLPWLIVK